MNLEEILYDAFGFSQFREGQKEVIASLLKERDTLGILPTGTGKSLCYQFMGHVLDGHVLIVSPLLSLMQDQVEQMKAQGEKRVIAINSFLNPAQKSIVYNSLNKYKYIFVSPEILQVDFILKKLQKLPIALFVVDEAHCISQWGYDFRTDYLKLGEIRKQLGSPLTLALTATATPEVTKDIIDSLGIGQASIFETSVDRPNIALDVELFEDTKVKQRALINHLHHLAGPGIIYFSSKKVAEQTVENLKANGIKKVMAYHGGMTHEDRILIQQQFIHGQIDYICATSAFGMGINKENIRFVIHFHMPLQMESYLQEIGRAGRDGEQSIAILLYVKGDENLALQLAEGELPEVSQLDWLYNEISYGENKDRIMSMLTEEMRLFGGFTEIQWRITKDFILTQFENKETLKLIIDNLKIFIEVRKSYKIKKIFDMVSYIKMVECRRKAILSYFGENIERKSVHFCCDNCGLDLNDFQPIMNHEVVNEPIRDWESQLINLLTSIKINKIDVRITNEK
jgi:ATP-dependent DNA helicase RecQ